jgi:hypothetical protein
MTILLSKTSAVSTGRVAGVLLTVAGSLVMMRHLARFNRRHGTTSVDATSGRENGAALWSSEETRQTSPRTRPGCRRIDDQLGWLVGARPELRVQQPAGSFPIKIVVA